MFYPHRSGTMSWHVDSKMYISIKVTLRSHSQSSWSSHLVIYYMNYGVNFKPGAVAQSVERGPHVLQIESSVPDWVKPITYQIDTCHFLARYSALTGWGNDLLAHWLTHWLSGMSGHGNDMWDSPIKLSWVHNVTKRYPSWYDRRCFQYVKLQQPTFKY